MVGVLGYQLDSQTRQIGLVPELFFLGTNGLRGCAQEGKIRWFVFPRFLGLGLYSLLYTPF